MFIKGRFHLSSFGVSCLDEIFLVARTEETNAELFDNKFHQRWNKDKNI